MTQHYDYGDFTFMSDDIYEALIKHVFGVVIGFPEGMKEMELDPGNDGYVVVTQFDSDIRKNIDDKLKTTDIGIRILDDSDIYRRIMGDIHDIACMEWEEFVERTLNEERMYFEEGLRLYEEFHEELFEEED